MNQYTEDTPTAFVFFAKSLSDAGVQISPMMIQYMAEQYSGYIGQTVIPALKSEKGDESGLLARLSQSLISTARKRVTSDPLTSNDIISQVYDSYYDMDAVAALFSGMRVTAEIGAAGTEAIAQLLPGEMIMVIPAGADGANGGPGEDGPTDISFLWDATTQTLEIIPTV